MNLDRLRSYEPRPVSMEGARRAAVLVPVLERAEGPAVLFTERSPDLEAHAGEMAFPGGGYEEVDTDLAATALREAHEEVGLAPEEAEVLARLDDVPGPFGHVVRPYVARVADRTYHPDEREVVAVVVIPVDSLTDPSVYSVEERTGADGDAVELPFFRVDDHVVWGLTGFVLTRLLVLTTDWDPPELPAHPLRDRL
jgi:8-oxo-dGTP pyrophosphatase MutT (NUDIX family)